MTIEFTYARTPEYFRPLLAREVRRPIAVRLAGAAALALLGLLVIWFGDDIDGVHAVWVGVLFAGIVAFILVRARRSYLEYVDVPPFWCAERRVVLDDDAIRVTTDLSELSYRWPLVQQVVVAPEAYHFALEYYGVLELPRARMTEQQEAELRTFLVGRGLLTAPDGERSPVGPDGEPTPPPAP